MAKHDELVKVLGRVDLNKDGRISCDDLRAAINNKDIPNFFSKKVRHNKIEDKRLEGFIRNSLIPLIKIQLKQFYDQMDTDGDKMVNISEFVQMFK